MNFKDVKIVMFVVGWLIVTAVFGRIKGDGLRVYVAYYLYILGWVLFLCLYFGIGATKKKVKQSLLLIIIVISAASGMPIWILSTWDRERLMHDAARYEHPIVLRMLFFQGVERHEIDQALLEGAAGSATKITEFTLAQGANPNARRDDGDTVLMIATQAKSEPIVAQLLKYGADVNARSSGRAALIWRLM